AARTGGERVRLDQPAARFADGRAIERHVAARADRGGLRRAVEADVAAGGDADVAAAGAGTGVRRGADAHPAALEGAGVEAHVAAGLDGDVVVECRRAHRRARADADAVVGPRGAAVQLEVAADHQLEVGAGSRETDGGIGGKPADAHAWQVAARSARRHRQVAAGEDVLVPAEDEADAVVAAKRRVRHLDVVRADRLQARGRPADARVAAGPAGDDDVAAHCNGLRTAVRRHAAAARRDDGGVVVAERTALQLDARRADLLLTRAVVEDAGRVGLRRRAAADHADQAAGIDGLRAASGGTADDAGRRPVHRATGDGDRAALAVAPCRHVLRSAAHDLGEPACTHAAQIDRVRATAGDGNDLR